jgi:hypothetical protein
MLKLYNSQSQITSDLSKFFKNIFPTISKPHLKIIPDIILGMIKSESVVTTDIIKKIKDPCSEVQPASIERKFERFFNNNKFMSYDFYNSIIEYIIKNYKLKNKNVYISFDHMYCKDKFTIFLLSLRIGKQGIPLWFRCFKGLDNADAFKLSLINQGISYVHNLFKDKKCNIIFLADRWFNFREIMQHIDSLGDNYCIRTKSNVSIEIDNYEYSDMISTIADIEPFFSKSKYFDSVRITGFKFPTKLAVSKTNSHKEPFFILTNGNTREAIKHYGYRFGSIEFIFKNQKSNGFYLESTKMRNIQSFTTLFTLVCVAILWLTILGADYSKNKNHFKNCFKIRYSKKNGFNNKRTFSLFNTGLFFFNLAFESTKYIVLKCSFILYDI